MTTTITIFRLIAFSIIIAWSIWSSYYILRLKRLKKIESINEHIYYSIPSVFTTLGVLFTFIGIWIGLQDFDVNNIDESIPSLLDGLKMAFSTSIAGIFLSILFSKWSQVVLNGIDTTSIMSNETKVLNSILLSLQELNKRSNDNSVKLISSIQGNDSNSISDHFETLKNIVTEQSKELNLISSSLRGDDEKSLLTQLQRLRSEQNDHALDNKKNVDFIVDSMNKNNELIKVKFDEFSDLLAKSNTEALVEVMKQVTEDFNAQMSELINRLVQENFAELNNSVKQLNDWQKENKEMIKDLTSQFKNVSDEFTITSESINEITVNTTKLTDKNSHLTKLIEELQKVMIEDTKFQEIIGKLTTNIDTLKTNTDTSNETSSKLNQWIDKQKAFNESVARLLIRLEGIDQIKDINQIFWNDTRNQLNEGVSLIKNASENLQNDLDEINEQFYDRLNDTLQNLDNLIKSIIQNNIQ